MDLFEHAQEKKAGFDGPLAYRMRPRTSMSARRIWWARGGCSMSP